MCAGECVPEKEDSSDMLVNGHLQEHNLFWLFIRKSYSKDKNMMEHVTLASVRRCEAHVLDPTFMMEHLKHFFQFEQANMPSKQNLSNS